MALFLNVSFFFDLTNANVSYLKSAISWNLLDSSSRATSWGSFGFYLTTVIFWKLSWEERLGVDLLAGVERDYGVVCIVLALLPPNADRFLVGFLALFSSSSFCFYSSAIFFLRASSSFFFWSSSYFLLILPLGLTANVTFFYGFGGGSSIDPTNESLKLPSIDSWVSYY